MMQRWLFFLWLLLLAAPTSALAQDPAGESTSETSSFDALVQEGAQAFGEKRYEEALVAFQEAYSIDPDSALLYNMGLIADRMGDYDKAVDYLNRFVTSPDIDLDTREEALKRLEQVQKLQALKADQESKAPVEEPEVKEPEVDPKEEKPEEVVEPVPAPDPDPHPKEEGPSYLGPVVVSSIGGALLIGGGAMGVLATMKHGEFEDATSLDERRVAADDGEAFALIGDGLFIGGGVLAVAGLTWFVIEAASGPNESEPGALALSPSLSHEGASLALTYVF